MTQRRNGGLIGAAPTSSQLSAGGIWTLPESSDARRNLVWPEAGTLVYAFVLAGGGGGYNSGQSPGGGGGSGGYIQLADFAPSGATYAITVGAGGSGTLSRGSNSVLSRAGLDVQTANGGGGGGGYSSNAWQGGQAGVGSGTARGRNGGGQGVVGGGSELRGEGLGFETGYAVDTYRLGLRITPFFLTPLTVGAGGMGGPGATGGGGANTGNGGSSTSQSEQNAIGGSGRVIIKIPSSGTTPATATTGSPGYELRSNFHWYYFNASGSITF